MYNHKMKIENAIEIFKMMQELDGFQTFDELADLANLKADEPINNDSFLDALMLNRYMFDNCKNSLCMFTAHSGEVSFLTHLKEYFLQTLERLRIDGRKAKIIFIADKQPEILEDEDIKKYLTSRVLEYFRIQVKDTSIVRHYIVCDDMVRIEEPHKELTLNSFASEIKAKMYFNAPVKARMMRNNFQNIWDFIISKGGKANESI